MYLGRVSWQPATLYVPSTPPSSRSATTSTPLMMTSHTGTACGGTVTAAPCGGLWRCHTLPAAHRRTCQVGLAILALSAHLLRIAEVAAD